MASDHTVYRGRVVHLRLETAHLPGGQLVELEVVRHSGAAAVVAMDESSRVVLLRQFRHAAGGEIWEIPAGRLEPGENPEQCARRELAEEAGIETVQLEPLGEIFTTPGFSDERIQLFLARGLTFGIPRREADEEIREVRAVPLQEAISMVIAGQIPDAKSALGILLARERVAPGSRSTSCGRPRTRRTR